MDANVGDHIIIESNKVGGARRGGEVLDVLHGASGDHFRVRWEDGHESIMYPSSDATVEPANLPRR